MDTKKLILKSVVVGIVLNVVLSYIVSFIASPEEVKPPNGAGNLSFYSQIIHMLVHHKHVMLTSSLIVGLLIGLSVYITCTFLK